METFKIYSTSVTTFDLVDRIRILFGKKLHTHTTIHVDKEVSIVKPSESSSYTDNIFPRKQKGYTETIKSDN